MKARQGGVIIPRKALCIKVKRVYNFIHSMQLQIRQRGTHIIIQQQTNNKRYPQDYLHKDPLHRILHFTIFICFSAVKVV